MYHSMSFVWSSYFLSLWTFWTHFIPLLLYNKIKGPFEGGTYVTSQHLVADLLHCTVRATSYPFLILVNSKGVFSEIRLHNVHATSFFFWKFRWPSGRNSWYSGFPVQLIHFRMFFVCFFCFFINAALFVDGLISIWKWIWM